MAGVIIHVHIVVGRVIYKKPLFWLGVRQTLVQTLGRGGSQAE